METGKTLRGGAQLAFDTAHSVTTIVEEMYRNIAAAPFPLGKAPEGRAPGIAGLVHESVRRVISTTRTHLRLAIGARCTWPGPHLAARTTPGSHDCSPQRCLR